MQDKLSAYHAKRNFRVTSEPKGKVAAPAERLRFVVQKHDARNLHYDFRLELDGTLKSWAVPKGPSLDPSKKRLAVHVEDHPLDYIDFQGVIPEHEYGAGTVEVWDTGYWESHGDPSEGYRLGKLKFTLDGEKLHGGWTLVRTRLQASGDKEQWLLIKENDDDARRESEFDIAVEMPDSVLAETPGRVHKDHAVKAAGKRAKTANASPAAKKTPARKTAAGKSTAAEQAADDAVLKNAVKVPLPEILTPQLATLVDAVPQNGDWIYELKFDGYRMLARISEGGVNIYTRDGNDWTAKLPKLASAVKNLGLNEGWLDGEAVVLDAKGVPSFQLLQQAFDEKSTSHIHYFIFDVPYLNGYDLRKVPLIERRDLLQKLFADEAGNDELLRLSQTLDQPPQRLLDTACEMSIEGIIGKRSDSIYTGQRSTNWIKLKCRQRQEFVIMGYTEPQGSRHFFGALLLGVYDNGNLKYAGRVGTGFTQKTLHSLHKQLKALEQDAPSADRLPSEARRGTPQWVAPALVAEVEFAEWTQDGIVRQATFQGLREDKPASEVTREKAVPTPLRNEKVSAEKENDTKPAISKSRSRETKETQLIQDVKITHPDRVIDTLSGLTKLDLALYYEHVVPHILPFLKNRPVYLLRTPEGIAGEQFFQKHSGKTLPIPGIEELDPALDPEHDPLMVINSAKALVGCTQMGMVELHTCGAAADMIERPDCMIFDLDPDPDLPWSTVVDGTKLTKVLLDELGLKSFLKTSGGKGLHVVVPLARQHEWDEVTAFSQAIAQHMARTIPTHFSAKMGAKNRIGKIFIDYLRNRRPASTVAAYSARARPGLPVSVPITWDELDEISSAAMWTIASLPERLAHLKKDPWADYFKTRQKLTPTMKKKLALLK